MNTILKEIINVLITERAVLRVERNTTTSSRFRDLDLARSSISGKRITFDELLQNIPDVRFFVSAITAIQATSEQDRGLIFPAVSFFIVYSPSDDCSEEIIFDALNNEDPEVDVVRIRHRQPGDGYSLAHVLFNVVKNHNNEYVNEMVRLSNDYCIQRRLNDPDRPRFPPLHFPRTSTRIVVVDAQFGPAIHAARQNLEADGLQCEVHSIVEIPPPERQLVNPTSDLTEALRTFERFMKRMGYALYKVYMY